MYIHFIWNDDNVPKEYDRFIESWKHHHPDATIRIWTFDEGQELINEHYPEIADLFANYEIPIQKANVLRYVLLHLFGGIYADLDMLCLKSLTDIYESCEAFIGKHDNYYLCNAVMGGIPGHAYWKRAIDGLSDALEWMNCTSISVPQRAIHSTGSPYMETFTPEFKNTVTIFDREYFYPVGCHEPHEFYAGEYPDAYTMHFWNYSWGRNYDGTRETITKMV